MPANTEWYHIHDKPHLKFNYNKICANSIHAMPFRALSIIENTPCKYIYDKGSDGVFEFKENQEVVLHRCDELK